jgi:long-chain fatty acid transport protein
MLLRRAQWALSPVLALAAVALSALPARAQLGPILQGPGPVNRSMGGAAVAAPVDGLGALYWNPATITAVPSSMDFGLELLIPHSTLTSSLPANVFGPGVPPVGLAGSTDSRSGIFALPSIGLVYTPDDSALSYGLGVFPTAGFGVNYAASFTNPLLTPQPPNGVGLGALYSKFQLIEIAPTLACKITDRLSIGGGATVDLASLEADPLFLVSPNTNGTYPPGTHTRISWGGGFQLGAYYVLDGGWSVGASFKSQQWLESFRWQTVDQFGRPRNASAHFDVPMIPSVGVAYSGFERLLLAADFRYVNFDHTPGFSASGFDATGAVRGLGWNSIFAMSLGAQYQLTDRITVGTGYTYNNNPIPDRQTFFNVASTTNLQHTVSVGASYRLTDALSLSLAYTHGFESTNTGSIVTPFGPVPGSLVQNKASVDNVLLGASVKFGPGSNRRFRQVDDGASN